MSVYYTIIQKDELKKELKKEFENFEKCSVTNLSLEVLKLLLINIYDKYNLNLEYINSLNIQNEIKRNENNKPYFDKDNLMLKDIYFNYSHTKNYIAVCVSNLDEVGIDIEESSRKISTNVVKRYLDYTKSNIYNIKLWTKKEAYSKMIGLGFKIRF